MTKQLILSTIIPLIGSSLPLGYGIGVMNSPQAVIRDWIEKGMYKNYDITLSPHQNVMVWSSVITIFLIGSTFGGLKGGVLADKFGRRKAFMFNHLLCLCSCGLFVLCKAYQATELLLSSQLLLGISAGLSSSLVPLYLSEIEPTSFKGMAVVHAFGITLGTFISQICGMSMVLGSAETWPYLACIPALCALSALLLHPYLKESPVFQKNMNLEKEPLLSTGMVSSDQHTLAKYNVYQLFKERTLHKPILLAILLYVISVFSGLYAIVSFGNVIFTSAGLNQQQSEIASICATGLQCVMGIIAIYLTKICRRRPLLLTSIAGCIVSLVMLMVFLGSESSIASYMAILSCVMYFIFYALGIGALPCAIATELLPEQARPLVMSLATALYWMSNILVGTSFPLVQSSIGEFSIMFFIFSCICSGLIFYFYLPETFINETVTEINNMTCGKYSVNANQYQRLQSSYIEI